MSTRLSLLSFLSPHNRYLSNYFFYILFFLVFVTVQSSYGVASPVPNSNFSESTEDNSKQKASHTGKFSTKATDLLPSCPKIYSDSTIIENNTKTKSSCENKNQTIAQTDSNDNGSNIIEGILQPTKDRLQINFNERDPYSFNWGLGSLIGEPTALQGGTRLKASPTVGQIDVVFPIGGYIEKGFGYNQRALLEIFGDVQGVVLDLSYTIAPQSIPGEFSFNVQTTRSLVGAFEGGNDVDLQGGADPWLHRTGGGFEYFFPFSSKFKLATALNYQAVSVRPGAFNSTIKYVDEQGNQVTVSDTGKDNLLTVNFAGILKTVDDESFPTEGTKLMLGVDASIPVGNASISYGRFTGSATQFIPVNFFSFAEGATTLVLNFQAGTFAGDVPPYDAFSMGGSDTIRGYRNGDVGTGSSFILTSVEYRFPIANDLKILVDFDLQGSLFIDYGADLGTADQVIGEPANVRNKDGDGLGFGIGLNLKTDFGLVRTEFGLSEEGDFVTHFTVGDRF